MKRTTFVGVATLAVSFLTLPFIMLGCSTPDGSKSGPAATSTALSTPTPISAPDPNSNGAMERANVQGTGVYVTKGVRQLTGPRWSFKTQDSGETTSPAIQGSTV